MLLINTHTGWANTELVVGQKSEPLQASLRITHSVRALSRSGRAGLIDESRAVRTGPFCQTFYHHLLFTHVHQLTHRTFLLNSWQPQCAGKCAGGINLRLDSLTHAQHTHTHTRWHSAVSCFNAEQKGYRLSHNESGFVLPFSAKTS